MDATTDTSAAPARRSRRRFLAAGAAPLLSTVAAAAAIEFPSISAPTEAPEPAPEPSDPPSRRVGFALVGLGRLSVNELLPAFAETRHCKPVALVSGDRAKALELARRHDIAEASVYDYRNFDRIRDDPAVDVVFIVLPNSMHAEFTQRAAAAGKHVLCEKPMATSSADCQRMIDACSRADRKLMVAYRSHYEPNGRALVKLIRAGRLGALKSFVSTNSQNQGDPTQWRLKKSLAGGGPLPDVGIYCINGIRYLLDQEPTEVLGWTRTTPGDPRFTEVEEQCSFVLRFAGGMEAVCHSGYSVHKSQMLRLMGSEGWAEMDPAYAYRGIKLRYARVDDGQDRVVEPAVAAKNQFALEMDHMARCVREGREPFSSGADGLQDQTIVEAIYASAREGRPVKLQRPKQPVRGPADTAG